MLCANKRGKDVVWPTGKQMEIIDSLYHNFYIPPVIFAILEDDDGEEIRICVDGKQRLTSIVKFLDGQVRPSSFRRSHRV
jgi:uncharacterized protein with ParB-like and HNH nuclease domain